MKKIIKQTPPKIEEWEKEFDEKFGGIYVKAKGEMAKLLGLPENEITDYKENVKDFIRNLLKEYKAKWGEEGMRKARRYKHKKIY